jgi:hypothetical protein
MARMQIKIERLEIEKRTSSLYDIVCILLIKCNLLFMFLFKIGINTNGNKPFTNQILEEINIGQLQIIINDLYYRIEGILDDYKVCYFFCRVFLFKLIMMS